MAPLGDSKIATQLYFGQRMLTQMECQVHTIDLLFKEANNAKTKKPLLDSEQLNKISKRGERNFVFPFSHCSQL